MAELVIQNPSITSGDFSFSGDAITAIAGHPVAGVGGGSTQSDYVYVPSFDDQTGDITFTLGITGSEGKGPWHISGAQGPQGPSGTNGTNGKDGISPTFTITPTAGGTHVVLSGAQGEESFDVLSGAKGADGKNGQNGAPGADGISPTFTTSVTSDTQHPQGGTHVVISGAAGESAFNVWNGVDGEGATVDLLEGNGIQITHEAGTTNYTIGVSADYMTTVSSDATLSGDGTSEHPLGIDTDKTYSLDGVDPIIVTSGAGNKTIIKVTDAAVSALNEVAQNKNIWDSVSAKSTVTVNQVNNEIKVEGSPSSAISATVYYPRTSNGALFAAQRIFMVETDADIYQCMTHTDGQGCLFFMLSARS